MSVNQAEAQASVDELLGESDHADFDLSGFVIGSSQSHLAERNGSFGQESFISVSADELSTGNPPRSGQRSRLERSGTGQSAVSDHADVVHIPGVTQDSAAWPVPSGRAYQNTFN
jgi:hypothetical protein